MKVAHLRKSPWVITEEVTSSIAFRTSQERKRMTSGTLPLGGAGGEEDEAVFVAWATTPGATTAS